MNIYLAAAMLTISGAASFGFGRVSAPPTYIKYTVYQNGNIYPGEFFSVSSSEFKNCKIILPKNFDATRWQFRNNIFDLSTGENLVPLLAEKNSAGNEIEMRSHPPAP